MARQASRFQNARWLALLLPAMLALPVTPTLARGDAPPGFMAADEEMVQKLLRVRSREDLATELESARRRKAAAEDDLKEMQELGSVVTARVAVKKQEIVLLKERARLAKKEADPAQAAQLENQRRQEEQQLDLFEAMRDASGTQVDRARAAREFADARIKLQEAELDLVGRREARVTRAAEPHAPGELDTKRQEELGVLDRQIRDTSRKVLSSIRDYARQSERLAKATESLAKDNLRLLDLWEEYSGR